jgi:hypothetical protein
VFLTYVRYIFFLHLLTFYTSCFSIYMYYIKEFRTLSVVETIKILISFRVYTLALLQRLSLLGLIFRFSTPTSSKIILVNFRISLLKYIKLINYYFEHYALFKAALLISFNQELLEIKIAKFVNI